MEYLDIEDKKTTELLKTCFENDSLIPIIGAGYSSGEKCKGGNVPNGDKFKELMIDAIISNSAKLKDHIDELKKREFSRISELYMNKDIVPEEKVKDDVEKYFLDVQLNGAKKDFLQAGWPYLYTLNIDDAIEKNSKFTPVLPYMNISEKSRHFGCVYKIHGDATHEVIYKEKSSLIFSSSQYISSLIKNESMLLFLKTDLIENNIIFIGCSLRDEIDLLYSIIGQDENPSDASRRIYVTTRRPNPIRELDLATYHVNTIVLIPNYEIFYEKILSFTKESTTGQKDSLEPFSFRQSNNLNNNKNINISFLLKSDSKFNGKPHYLTTPKYLIERTQTNNILKSCLSNPVTIMKGRRFSGKSLLLLNIANKTSQKHIYYFSSTVSVSEQILEECFAKENALFIFDTNVLNYRDASCIRSNINKLIKTNSNILIACNPTEVDIYNTFVFSFDGDFYFEIENKLDHDEYININKKLSELGIINFQQNKNILDNTFYLSKEYPDRRAKIVDYDQLESNEIKTLLVISVFDKIYSSAARAIGLHLDGMQELAQKLHPILELEATNKAEIQHHSHTKLSLNSKQWLFQILSDFNKNKGNKQTSKLIKELVESFINNPHFTYIQQKVIMFDTLNQVFSYESGGAGSLIKEVYVTIQPLLSDNPDYWLQRAKSILKLERKDIPTIKDGIDYARKAFNDGIRKRTINNAEFTIALLYGKLCKLENYSVPKNIVESIEWFHTAINKNRYNKSYVDSMLEHSRRRKGHFHYLCNYLEKGQKDITLLNVRDQIQDLLHYYNEKPRT